VVSRGGTMTIDRDVKVEFDEARILGMHGDSMTRVLTRPGGRESWEGALADARALVQPAAAWELVPVAEFRHASVVLAGGARLGGGPLADVVAGAAELAVAVCTVGQALSERIKEHQRARKLLRGVMLDELGSWAVDNVRQQVCSLLQKQAEASGLRVSTSLSPGESEWPLEDQAVLFSLLDAGSIGVSLGPTMLMTPLKSLSFVLGRGSNLTGREGGSHCDFCVMKERCTYRCVRETTGERGST
jgi:hypothetical protein